MAYTTSDLIKASLGRDLTSQETTLLALLIPAVQRYIDRKTGSTFDTAEATSRLYDVSDSTVVDIDPCQSISAVAYVDENGTSSNDYIATDYVAEPVNETVKRWLHLRHKVQRTRMLANIKVTAKFTEYDFAGSKVPEDIQMIATMICKDIVSKLASTEGDEQTIKSESIEGHTITYADAASSSSIEAAALNNPFVVSVFNQRTDLMVG